MDLAHPPGYPLYALFGRLWLLIFPLGNFAYRLNALSCAMGAAAVATLFLALRPLAGARAALGAALGLALSAPLWKFSLLQEMYSWQALFAALLFVLSQGEKETFPKRAIFSAFFFGLGLVNHQSLVLLAPALAYLWRGQALEQGRPFWRELGKVVPFLALGLLPEALLWLRLKDWSLAWAVFSRAEYGALSLFSGFAQEWSLPLIWRLTCYFVKGLWEASSPVLFLLSLWGAWRTLFSRTTGADERSLGRGAVLGLFFSGPLFFCLSRFDVSGWVARSVLETAFVVPSVLMSLLAGLGLAAVEKKMRWLGMLLLGLLILLPLWNHGPAMNHREDFSAYDYARALRRLIPPGSDAVVRGDTALFSLKYLEALEPQGRTIMSELEPGLGSWIQERLARGPVYFTGMPWEKIRELGVTAEPLGLVQRSGASSSPDAERGWELSPLRPGPALLNGESYAHDIRLSYAFAHYLAGQYYEARRKPAPALAHYQKAAQFAPEDFQLVADY